MFAFIPIRVALLLLLFCSNFAVFGQAIRILPSFQHIENEIKVLPDKA